VNFVSDRIFATGADGTWRLYRSVSHGTLDILPLDPSASWAGKRSQILAGVTRLNGRASLVNRKLCIGTLDFVCRA
jgi:hypothetical protein